MAQDNSKPDWATLCELLQEFDTAMLVTRRDAALQSRPTAVAGATADGRIRFITGNDSGTLAELEDDDSVNVSMQGYSTFLSISGHARLTGEETIFDEGRHRKRSPGFAGGRGDQGLIVVEVIPVSAEFWGRGSVGVIRFTLEKFRCAAFRDDRLRTAQVGLYGRVDFHGRPL